MEIPPELSEQWRAFVAASETAGWRASLLVWPGTAGICVRLEQDAAPPRPMPEVLEFCRPTLGTVIAVGHRYLSRAWLPPTAE